MGLLPGLPTLAPLSSVTRLDSFRVSPSSGTHGRCEKHGPYFSPVCFGDLPGLALVSSTTLFEDSILFEPLYLEWNGNELSSTTDSKALFIPNLYGRQVPEKYAILGKSLECSEEGQYVYCIGSGSIADSHVQTLQASFADVEHRADYIWNTFSFMVGTLNEGKSVVGTNLFPVVPRATSSLVPTRVPRLRSGSSSALAVDTDRYARRSLQEQPVRRNVHQPSVGQHERTSRVSRATQLKKTHATSSRSRTKLYESTSSWSPGTGNGSTDEDESESLSDKEATSLAQEIQELAAAPQDARTGSQSRSEEEENKNEEQDSVIVISSDDAKGADVQVSAPGSPKPAAICASTNSGNQDSDGSDFSTSNSTVPSCDYDYEPERLHERGMTYEFEALAEQAKEHEKLLERRSKRLQGTKGEDQDRPRIRLWEGAGSVVVAQSYRTPFFSAPCSSLPDLKPSELAKSKTSCHEALEIATANNLELVRSSLSDGHNISFDEALPRKCTTDPEFMSLRLEIDVDSIDFVTCPLGGMALHRSACHVYLVWENSLLLEKASLERNNGLVGFELFFPDTNHGRYFGSTLYRNRKPMSMSETALSHPIHVVLFESSMPLFSRPLKVSALVPSRTLLQLISGEAALLELFKDQMQDTANGSGARNILSKLVWYLLSSMILFMASLGTKEGSRCAQWTRRACCAIPSRSEADRECHDRRQGHLSSFQSKQALSSGAISVALCLFARHQRAIEQHAEVPETYLSRLLSTKETYTLPKTLHGLVSSDVLPILKSDIGSPQCLEYFRALWQKGWEIGNFISLQSEPDRRGEQALPNERSNIRAFRRKKLVLEDLLCLNGVLLRGTVHGMKTTAFDTDFLSRLEWSLKDSFDPSCFIDGNIDIGHVLRGPEGKGFGVHFRRKTLEDVGFMVPATCTTSARDLGAYILGTSGYPDFVGFSTSKGGWNNPTSSMSVQGIRKLKVYSTKWELDAERGKTIYATSSVLKLRESLVSENDLLQICNGSGERSVEELLTLGTQSFSKVLHNIEHRSENLSLPTPVASVRVEHTCFFDRNFLFLQEPYNLLTVQACVAENLSGIIEDDIPVPWWTLLSAAADKELPVALVPDRTLQKWSLCIEKKLVELSKEVFKRGFSFLSGNPVQESTKGSDFLVPLLESLEAGSGCSLLSFLVRGLLEAASMEVDGHLCHRTRGTPLILSPELAVCGLAASSWVSGYPSILLSRLCSFPSFSQNYTLPGLSIDDASLCRAADDLCLPRGLRFIDAFKKFGTHMNNLGCEAMTSTREENFMRVYGVLKPLLSVIRISSERDKVMDHCTSLLAALAVRTMLSDIAHSIENAFGQKPDLSRHSMLVYRERFGSPFGDASLRMLQDATMCSKYWPRQSRIDFTLSQEGRQYETTRRAVAGITRPFPRGKALIAVVDNSSSWKSRVLDVDRSGFLTDTDYIQTLWSAAFHECHTKKAQEGKWEVCGVLHSIAMIFQASRCTEFFPTFGEEFSTALSSAMRGAGFAKVCPALSRFQKDQLFGPNLLFAKMKFSQEKISLPLHSTVAFTASMLSCSSTANSITMIWKELSSICEQRFKCVPLTEEWYENSSEYVKLSKLFWNISGIDEILEECLQKRFTLLREEKSLIEADLQWASSVLKSLISIRRVAGDEGVAARLDGNGTVLCFGENDEGFNEKLVMSRPWGERLYPSPESIFKKKTRVGKLAELVDASFSLLFQSKTGLGKGGTIQYGDSGAEWEYPLCYEHLLVEDVYHFFGKSKATTRMQWRLAPTRIVAEILSRTLSSL